MRLSKKMMVVLGVLGAAAAATMGVSLVVARGGDAHIVDPASAPQAQCAIVLGCYVGPNGVLSDMLRDRVHVAVQLYKTGKVKKLLMSGDHGRTDYDEPNAMRGAAESLGVPREDVFMDHAGFNTYDTMARASRVFQVQSAIVVTQRFHLARAVWLARQNTIEACGVPADLRPYQDAFFYELRDAAARVKAFADVMRGTDPTFLGTPIPITGDGRQTDG